MTAPRRFPAVHCSGAPFSVGLAHGTRARAQVVSNIAAYRQIFREMAKLEWGAALAIAAQFAAALTQSHPAFLDEMRGIAEGAGVPLLHVVALN
ncbi:hypothetical protein FIBSPDRAFT_771183, partial [Athelia psychrophila]